MTLYCNYTAHTLLKKKVGCEKVVSQYGRVYWGFEPIIHANESMSLPINSMHTRKSNLQSL